MFGLILGALLGFVGIFSTMQIDHQNEKEHSDYLKKIIREQNLERARYYKELKTRINGQKKQVVDGETNGGTNEKLS